LSAPAKLNLSLRVLGIRPDGFHELESLTVMVSAPADELSIGAAAPGAVDLVVHGGGDDVPRDADNLVVRAARAVLPAGVGISIELHKCIPSGAGLGGGSADAGAVLRVLRDELALDSGRVLEVAATLGSDVPVCVDGHPVMMRGRGDVLDRVELAGDLHVVVATPPIHLATPPVFRAWDAMGGPRSPRTVPPPPAVAHLVDELANDLEVAAESVAPGIAEFRSAFERLAGGPVVMAGSGSSYWTPVPDADVAAALAARARDELRVAASAGTVVHEVAG
jgi:4-diphosphocytidyl-2-C-methyl-D-erythritol kinase